MSRGDPTAPRPEAPVVPAQPDAGRGVAGRRERRGAHRLVVLARWSSSARGGGAGRPGRRRRPAADATWVADAGAIATSTAYTWGLAARTGGRPLLFSALTLALGVRSWCVDSDSLRSGAAVVTAVLTAVFAVMATVPAVHVAGAVREVVVALLLAAVGAMATPAWAPVVNLARFQYTVLGLSFVAAFVTVYRLGAGFHGLGTRGVFTVVARQPDAGAHPGVRRAAAALRHADLVGPSTTRSAGATTTSAPSRARSSRCSASRP